MLRCYLTDTDPDLALEPPQAAALLRRASEEETRKPGPGIDPAGRAEEATLCRYITRPVIANERLGLNRAGQVVLTLKTPYREGTTHIVMSLLEFIQRLAALVPRPRLHLIRFHGVLAPNARLRPDIIPTCRSFLLIFSAVASAPIRMSSAAEGATDAIAPVQSQSNRSS